MVSVRKQIKSAYVGPNIKHHTFFCLQVPSYSVFQVPRDGCCFDDVIVPVDTQNITIINNILGRVGIYGMVRIV